MELRGGLHEVLMETSTELSTVALWIPPRSLYGASMELCESSVATYTGPLRVSMQALFRPPWSMNVQF